MANRYGLNPDELGQVFTAHKRAREAQDQQALKAIEDRLTDMNYHTILNLMDAGEYDKALEYYRQGNNHAWPQVGP